MKYILTKVGFAIATLFVVSVIVFLLVHANPTTPGVIAIGMGGTPEQVKAYNESIGWYDPLVVQYWRWASQAVQGNFGVSLTDGREIGPDILTRLPVTASLAAGATILSAIIGVTLGVWAAVRGGGVDRSVKVSSGIAASLPAFWLGIGLVFVFSVELRLLPATGYVPFDVSPAGWASSLALPVMTLAIGGAAFLARQTRASMQDALAQDHIRTLRATGTPQRRILYVHALRFASLPIIAAIALQFIGLFGGSVIAEQLFAMPGLGFALQASVGQSDAPTVQALVVVATLVVVIVNLALELATKFLDPKLRTS